MLPVPPRWNSIATRRQEKSKLKRFGFVALVVFAAVLLEVALIFLEKTKGELGFKITLRPDV
jgi:hypothetical protein